MDYVKISISRYEMWTVESLKSWDLSENCLFCVGQNTNYPSWGIPRPYIICYCQHLGFFWNFTKF
jgi:hypothetical protein